MKLIVIIVLAIIILLSVTRKPDHIYWALLLAFFNPGGLFTLSGSGVVYGYLWYYDVIFFGMMLTFFTLPASQRKVKDPKLRKFLLYIFVLYFFYFVVYGFLIPLVHGEIDYLYFLRKSRFSVMYFPIIYSFIIFFGRNQKIFFNYLLYSSFVILGMWMISISTPLKILPVNVSIRYAGEEMGRIYLTSYGLMDWIFPLGLYAVVFRSFFKIPKSKFNLLLLSAIFMLITLLVTLTRREYIRIGFSIIIIFWFSSRVFHASALKFWRTMIIVVFAGFIMMLSLPKYTTYIRQIFADTFYLITEGKDTRGEGDYRISLTGDYDIVFRMMKSSNLITGIGNVKASEYFIKRDVEGNIFAIALDAAFEVPVIGIIWSYGILGVFLVLPFYIGIFRLIVSVIRSLKKSLYTKIPYYSTLFILLALHLFFIRFTTDLYTLFNEIKLGSTMFTYSFMYVMLYYGSDMMRSAEKNQNAGINMIQVQR